MDILCCVGGKHSFSTAYRDKDVSSSLYRKVAAVQYNESGEIERDEREIKVKVQKGGEKKLMGLCGH